MKIHLFTDKQSSHLAVSINRIMVAAFNKELKKREAMIEAEVAKQIETSEEIKQFKKEREEKYTIYKTALELRKQLEALDLNVSIKTDGHSSRSGIYVYGTGTSLSDKLVENFKEQTEKNVKELAEEAARKILNINDIHYRKDALYDDICARLAVMGVCNYDVALANIKEQIIIEDYFIEL